MSVDNWELEKAARLDAKPGSVFLKMLGERIQEEVAVDRVTETQVILANGVRLKKKDGGLVGGIRSFHSAHYRPDLPHLRERDRTRQAEIEARDKLAGAVSRLRSKADSVRDVSGMEALTAQINALLDP